MLGGGSVRTLSALVAVMLVAAACGGDAEGDRAADGAPGTAPGEESMREDGSAAPRSSTRGAPGEPEPSEPPPAPTAEPPEPPDSPGSPEAPEPPDSSGSPEAPEPPDSSGSPDAPEPPDSSGSPETPEPPEPPDSPDSPDSPESAGASTAPAPHDAAQVAADSPDASGSGGGAEASSPTEPTGERPDAAAGLEFAGCGQDYLCGTLTVPLDHDDPGGASLELAVGMIPAGDPDRRIGYLLVNPGGPGGGMSDFLNAGAGLSSRLLDRFDVVGWDPRGVGGSVPSRCQAEARELFLVDPAPDSPSEQAELAASARAVAEACAANLGDAVGHIGTIDTVRDMDAIRRALAADTISYLGFSYGTMLGLLYAEMFGEHLRAAVLDGVVDPSLTATEATVGQTIGFTRTIDDMFAWCRAEPTCAVSGDPAEAYERLLARLDAEPLRDLTDRVVLDPARGILATVLASYSSDLWPFYFIGLAAAIDGDGTMFGRLGEAYIELADLGAFISIGCADSGAAARAGLDALGRQLVEVAGDFGWASLMSIRPCEYWPVTAGTLPTGAVAAPAAPPILVLGNRGDNATPYEWATSVAGQLRSGVLVSYDGTEHTSYGTSDCVSATVDDYLVEGIVPAGGVDCPAEPG